VGNASGPALRRSRARIDGILLLDKPVGITSNAALVQSRTLFGAAKAGHTGTLDPLASGLLPICFGEATKFGALLLDADKTYEAEVALGAATTTGDAEGEVLFRGDVSGAESKLEPVLRQFLGEQTQTPPMYSALKHMGRPLYSYARAGEEVERTPRTINVHQLEAQTFDGQTLRIRVRVSKGTYVRTLAHDIGTRLGCGAHLKGLRRTAVGTLSIDDATTLERLGTLSVQERHGLLGPADMLVRSYPRLDLTAPWDDAMRRGQRVPAPANASRGLVGLYDRGGVFIGLGEVHITGEVVARRLVAEAQQPLPSPAV
jgi:tRNA pseudouridine55 synthase